MTTELIKLNKVHIEPNNCALNETLKIRLMFESKKDLVDVCWKIEYVVDFTSKRRIIQVGNTGKNTYKANASHEFEYETDQLKQLDHIPSQLLNNTGLLVLTLLDSGNNDKEMFKISMVTNIIKKKDNTFQRVILSPI